MSRSLPRSDTLEASVAAEHGRGVWKACGKKAGSCSLGSCRYWQDSTRKAHEMGSLVAEVASLPEEEMLWLKQQRGLHEQSACPSIQTSCKPAKSQ